MKEPYPEEIMLCFVQGFGNGSERRNGREYEDRYTSNNNNNNNGGQIPKKKNQQKRVSLQIDESDNESIEFRPSRKSSVIVTGKSLRLSTSGDRFLKRFPEVKRSFSDRFSTIAEPGGKITSRGLLTIRKTRSTGNFSAGGGAGGCGSPRSAPATPLQLEPPRHVKHEKHAVKPLSSSTPSVRTAALSVSTGTGVGAGTGASSDASEGKTPSKARQKKFLRHFPQVGPDERVLNYYSCALVGDILLQGHLYITKNYFAFYSNVFGYVTKLLIPTASVQRVSKEKMARIIPNAVGVCTRDERHVFGSLLSRDNTYKLMTQVWKLARAADDEPPPQQDLPISEVDLDVSEYSPEDESSSGGGERPSRAHTPLPPSAAADAILTTAAGVATVIQPALLTGGVAAVGGSARPGLLHAVLLALAALLAISAIFMAHQLYTGINEEQIPELSGPELYSEVARWRSRLHGRAAAELHTFLHTNLMLLAKVRQSLETLSNVILSDISNTGDATVKTDLPNDTTYS